MFLGALTHGQLEKPLNFGTDNFYSVGNRNFTVLHKESNVIIKRFTNRRQRLFVLRFYHDRKNFNFLKDLKFVGQKNIAEIGFPEVKKVGRKLYKYSTHIASINN